MSVDDDLASRFCAEHRELDELFGRFLQAAFTGQREAASHAIAAFDGRLRRHTETEEATVLARPSGKLVPSEAETRADRLARELAVEHVQVRELSGILVRRLSEDAPIEEVRALAGNLARRWDAHTRREEGELLKTSR